MKYQIKLEMNKPTSQSEALVRAGFRRFNHNFDQHQNLLNSVQASQEVYGLSKHFLVHSDSTEREDLNSLSDIIDDSMHEKPLKPPTQ
ncbi:hypothetical protein FGO68_gene7817 [Halteria grandinella]|uniref:Uncharacterized protein n=1 Tax=Halteria grandinella TaxID=5974 RepID=A0A8J8NZI7_HALGN|nr:hypothetical protein FGO68_gene7817 [Halteria grandinella]